MLINLIPDFFAVLNSSDRVGAYQQYFDAHHARLSAYWQNYILDPESEHFLDVVRMTVFAERSDLRAMLERTDVVAMATRTGEQVGELLGSDVDFDIVLMVGVGGANAGELVVAGRGMAFVSLEHFTGVPNPETQGLGLDPELIPMWLAHEIAHAVRYTSPGSRSEIREIVEGADGYYSYWETGRRASLRELLVNEGLAVTTGRLFSPGLAAWEYYGYGRRQYARVRELEPMIGRAVGSQLDERALGLRLRYLLGGTSEETRTIERVVVPERAGYFVGTRMVEAAVSQRGLPWAIRASAREITDVAAAAAITA
ncbi:MAG: hypothetical protein ACT4OZ_06390 [Gemmatimonadota bacterium]